MHVCGGGGGGLLVPSLLAPRQEAQSLYQTQRFAEPDKENRTKTARKKRLTKMNTMEPDKKLVLPKSSLIAKFKTNQDEYLTFHKK